MPPESDLMGILNLFGKKDVSADLSKRFPYEIRTEFVPYKLKARQKATTSFVIRLKNITGEPLLSSVVVDVPRQLSMDSIGLAKQKELRLGILAPGEEKESRIDVNSGVGTDKGEYTISLTAFAHYRDYGHVLNAMKKSALLEAV